MKALKDYIVDFSINQLPTDTFKNTYAYRFNSFSRSKIYKPAIFVTVNSKTFLFSK